MRLPGRQRRRLGALRRPEKVRPITGWSTLAFALDWLRPPRQQATTAYWFLMSDQWRYQRTKAGEFATPLGSGKLRDLHLADTVALAARLGWTPLYPSFDRNPLDLCDAAEAEGLEVPDYVVRELGAERLRFAAEDPDAPANYPRVLTLWRANLLGSSSKVTSTSSVTSSGSRQTRSGTRRRRRSCARRTWSGATRRRSASSTSSRRSTSA